MQAAAATARRSAVPPATAAMTASAATARIRRGDGSVRPRQCRRRSDVVQRDGARLRVEVRVRLGPGRLTAGPAVRASGRTRRPASGTSGRSRPGTRGPRRQRQRDTGISTAVPRTVPAALAGIAAERLRIDRGNGVADQQRDHRQDGDEVRQRGGRHDDAGHQRPQPAVRLAADRRQRKRDGDHGAHPGGVLVLEELQLADDRSVQPDVERPCVHRRGNDRDKGRDAPEPELPDQRPQPDREPDRREPQAGGHGGEGVRLQRERECGVVGVRAELADRRGLEDAPLQGDVRNVAGVGDLEAVRPVPPPAGAGIHRHRPSGRPRSPRSRRLRRRAAPGRRRRPPPAAR